ncbi:MAG: hypothetical protein J6K64_03435 [Clostridia bacterium]|nr:hypothetical protein [Clostridia bacterium]
MLSILYAATFPWLLVFWLPLAIYLIFGVDVKPKLEDIDRNTPQIFKIKHMYAKAATKMMIFVGVLLLVASGYNLIDLIARDFVTCEATYVGSEIGDFGGLERNYIFDNNGEIIKVSSLREKENANYSLEKGENYSVTYAKRTNMVVRIDGQEKIDGSEQPLNVAPIYIILFAMFLGIAGCIFGVWRIRERKEF